MSLGKKALQVIGAIAPMAATALGGPLAGGMVKALADRFTGGDEGKLDDFIVNADPATLKEVKIASMEHVEALKELDIKELETHQRDRASARDLAAINMWPQIALSAAFFLGYFSILYVVFTGRAAIPEDMMTLANILIGILTAGIPMILQFWFGSSKGSKDKSGAMTAAMRTMANGK